jgi:hypothetical protein
MDCLEAQQLVSAALDREPVDAALLEEAKSHCRGCAECQVFVRTLSTVHRTAPPAPAPDLADRVIARIAGERQRDRASAAVAAKRPAPTAATASAAQAASADQLVAKLRTMWATPRRRAELVGWVAMAAVVLVFAGVVSMQGIRTMLSAGQSRVATQEFAGQSQAAAPVVPGAAATGNPAADSSLSSKAATATAGSYVTFNGLVYVYERGSTYPRSSLTSAGSVSTALDDAAAAPIPRPVYTTPDLGVIVVDPGSGASFMLFRLVSRQFGGVTYNLASPAIERFGVWPTMPPPMAPPSSPDGAPDYIEAGTSAGILAYTRAGATAEAGIAIPPGTPPTDPAAANPNWTWWVPKK